MPLLKRGPGGECVGGWGGEVRGMGNKETMVKTLCPSCITRSFPHVSRLLRGAPDLLFDTLRCITASR